MALTTRHTGRLWMWSFLALTIFAVGAGVLISRWIDDSKSITDFVGLATAMITACGAVATPILRSLDSRKVEPAEQLTNAADTLAEAVARQWGRAAGDRQLRYPAPIPVRWRWSVRSVTGSVESAVSPQGQTQFAALPRMLPVTSEMVSSGGLRDLVGVYSGLRSGRLVILGGPGTGKSAAGILLLLDALEHRRSLDDDERATVPVPVLLTVHGWDPRWQPLNEWLATRLVTDFTSLLPGKASLEIAVELVKKNRVALFLDGFDEMAPDLRAIALRAMNQQVEFRLVLLTRSSEFVEAIGSGHLYGAAALELQPISGSEAADYLAQSQVQPLPPAWRRLVEHLRKQSDNVLTLALDSPLMLTLVRDTFQHQSEIEELLMPDKFNTREEVETHLLDRVLPTAYRDRPGQSPTPYHLDHARRWLSYIAAQMNSRTTRDLAWWQMHHWTAKPLRVLITILAIGIPSAFGVWFTVKSSNMDEIMGFQAGLIVGPASGVLVGLSVGLIMERGEPTVRRRRAGRLRFNSPIGFMVGIVSTLVAVLVIGASDKMLGLVVGVGVGLISGLASGLASGIGPKQREIDYRRTSRSRLNALWSRFNPLVGLACGLPVMTAIAFAPPPASEIKTVSGPPYGLAFGVALGVAFGLLDGFSRPRVGTTIPTDPTHSWHRDLQRSLGLGIPFGIAIGLVGGIGVGGGTGLVSGLLAGGAIGTVAVLVAGVSVSSLWQTRLLFLQLWLRGDIPLHGLRFLKDAHERGVLRIVGPVYQFRHARLQDKLAERYMQENAHVPERQSTSEF